MLFIIAHADERACANYTSSYRTEIRYRLDFAQQVHARTWKCGSVTCNCGIAVREGDDVIILDMCWDGIPRLRFASKKVPAEGTVVRRDPTGKSIIVS